MSGLERIIQYISMDAQSSVEKTLGAARQEASSISHESRIATESEVRDIIADREKKAQIVHERIENAAWLKIRKEALALKQEYLTKVFDNVIETLNGYSTEKLEKIFVPLILKNINTGTEELIFNAADQEKIGRLFCDSINARRKEMGKKAQVRLSDQTRPIKGGVIVRDGQVECNLSFEALIEDIRPRIENELIAKLFGRMDQRLDSLEVS